jgi:NAD(P)-dependent dehydrogenase (short-subunit alcohol dehydrogenase family)
MAKPVCAVVGVGAGLGIALVRIFAERGCRVAMIARRADMLASSRQTLRAEGLDVESFPCDASDSGAVTHTFESIRQTLGAPDILIYNAAIIVPARFVTPSGSSRIQYGTAPPWDTRGKPADFDYLVDTFKTNVAGALHAVQQVTPSMLQKDKGTILLTGGVLAFDPWLEWGVTALGKAALRSLGRSLALELSPMGIHVTTVAIHGTMETGTPYDPLLVAKAYWDLHQAPAGQWEAEFHFKH